MGRPITRRKSGDLPNSIIIINNLREKGFKVYEIIL
tara:strand:+ start:947 stop:1054 length:108 start_codon:yes stop_codon:yes gene_type:complete